MDKKIVKRINELVKDIKRNPFEGFGKPEPLKYDLAGKWSRRITDEHSLVYQVDGENLIVFTCRYHYWSTGRGMAMIATKQMDIRANITN